MLRTIVSNATLVLTVIAEDQPGVVERISQTVADHGGNWEESRMARLAGRFAGILLVQVASDRVDALSKALAQLVDHGMHVVIDDAGGDREELALKDYAPLHLELVGQDHGGIIRDIARCLAERGVNVEELITSCEEAPMAGGDLFRMVALVLTPPGMPANELRQALEGLANDLMVDISLRDE